jgi:V8-like Glu-specific endopeptidase
LFAASSSETGDDWAAVRVSGEPNAQWGALDIVDIATNVNDFVNIIQHPGGMPKQIALYHNMVVYSDGKRVQYLTDTMPGSSGSPVFDTNWRVVALHHSGGWLAQPGTNKVFFRNEGISARALVQGLGASGVRGGAVA